ncbi:MAG: hypothetical protein HZA08_10195 [Nitrospirae bacterium]|nr:hypothetical protein [Nitrospirota bacterium]
MEISVKDTGIKTKSPVNVRAVALYLRSYYRMDTVLPPDRPLIWPLEEVLHPVGLRVNDIGILGWIGNEDDRTFIPLRVSQKGKDSAGQPSDPVNLVIRCAVDVVEVKWSYYVEGEQGATPKWEKVNLSPSVSAGNPITITLPEGLPAKAILEVRAKELNRGYLPIKRIRVSVKGSL